MEQLQKVAEGLHPVADHFTIALFTIAVLADLAASVFSQRAWLRHMSLTLTVLAALAAGASFYTGNLESERVKAFLTAPAKDMLYKHALWGGRIVYVIGVLALVRIILGLFGSLARLRSSYLLVAIVALGLLYMDSYWGAQLVYTYGVGTKPGEEAMSRPKGAIEEFTKGLIRKVPIPSIESPTAKTTPPASSVSSPEVALTPAPLMGPATSTSPGASPTSPTTSTPQALASPTHSPPPISPNLPSPSSAGEGGSER